MSAMIECVWVDTKFCSDSEESHERRGSNRAVTELIFQDVFEEEWSRRDKVTTTELSAGS